MSVTSLGGLPTMVWFLFFFFSFFFRPFLAFLLPLVSPRSFLPLAFFSPSSKKKWPYNLPFTSLRRPFLPGSLLSLVPLSFSSLFFRLLFFLFLLLDFLLSLVLGLVPKNPSLFAPSLLAPFLCPSPLRCFCLFLHSASFVFYAHLL